MEWPFMEGLPDELGACPPNVDPPLSAACLQHGSDAGITLQFRGARPAIALRTKGSYEPRNQSISSPREGVEQVEIRAAFVLIGVLGFVWLIGWPRSITRRPDPS